ncbi:MAG: response regulator transcription factor [Acidobacteria bacterium]|nr:response regulator transcription factor [Acidobacteriota bacterium]
MKTIRVLLVDDHTIVRRGLAGLLRSEDDLEIIGETGDGESAVALTGELRPDVVIMDIGLPGMDGIEATRIIHREFPDVRVIGFSMFRKSEQEKAMREAGVAAYVEKSAPADAVIEAIRTCVH